MVGSTPAASWRLTNLLCHASVLFSETQGFTPAAAAAGCERHRTQPSQQAELKCHSHRRALLMTPMAATPQREQPDDGAWWEGEVDPWTDAESRALMQQFKNSVLDEDGLSVRAMSDESVRELADQAAEGILEVAEREFMSRLPPPSSTSTRLFNSEDPSAATVDGYKRAPTREDAGGISLLSKGEGDREEEEDEDEEDEGVLDWGDGAETKGGPAGGVVRGGAQRGFLPPPLESIADRAEYESTLAALKAYYRQHGNLLLTQKYVMPSGEDRGEMLEHRGWRLGQKAYNMKFWKRHVRARPSRREELAALGFVWGRLQDEYNLFVEALLAYKDIEGSLLVPSSFVVPETSPWPLSCQGMRLGAKVSGVRNQSLYVRADVARWYQLDAMGFVWDLSDAPFRQVYEALLQYKAQNGNLHVPVAFRVPSSSPWDQDLWGLALGQRVLDIRARHRYIRNDPDRIRLLNEAGFRWTDATKASYGDVVRALKAYRKVKGRDFSVPSSFVVPSFLPWPQSCWGLRLGTALVDIRSKGRYLKGEEREQRRRELECLGVFAQSREAILANVVTGLRRYQGVFGDTMVPQGFVVPDGEAWPRECWGQKLGSMLYGIRRRPERLDRHPGVRAELTALGFSWEVPKKGPRGPRKRKPLVATTTVASAGGDVNGAATNDRCVCDEVGCRQVDESQVVMEAERRPLRPPLVGLVPAADGKEEDGKGAGISQKLVAKVIQPKLISVDEGGGAAAAPPQHGGVDIARSQPRRNSSSGVAGRNPAKTDAESIGKKSLVTGSCCRPQSRERAGEVLVPTAR